MESKDISVIIPVVRPDKVQVCIESVKRELPFAQIVAEEDKYGIGAPRMVNMLVRQCLNPWICFLGDDTELESGFLDAVTDAHESLAGGWGVIGLNTEGKNAKAHWMAHKRIIDHMPDGVLFSEEYKHCWCDNELYDISTEMNRWIFAINARVQHHHPVNGGEVDKWHCKAYSPENKKHDKQTYIMRKRERLQKTAIGFPLVDPTIPVQFFTSFACMDKPTEYILLVPKFPHGPWTGSIADARNSLVEQAQMEGASQLLMLDTDQTYPPDCLTKLLSHKKDVCGVRVHRRWMPFDPIFLRGDLGKYKNVPDEEAYSGDLIEVDATGTGCLLFNMEVFDKIEYPWFQFSHHDGKPVGEDINFCHKARSKDIKIHIDTSIEVGHLTTMEVNKTLHQICKHMVTNIK